MVPACTSCPPNRLTPSRCPCELRPLTDEPPPFLCAIQIPLERNFADLHGGIILPVPALDLVLAARLILEHDHLAMAVLRDDLAGYGRSGGILAGYQLGLIRAHREHFA